MKVFWLGPPADRPGPVWLGNFASSNEVVKKCCDAVIVNGTCFNRPSSRLGRWLERTRDRSRLCREVGGQLDPDGENLLVVTALGGPCLNAATALEPLFHRFSRKCLVVRDTMRGEHVPRHLFRAFDEVWCYCADQAAAFTEHRGKPCTYWPASADVLDHHSLRKHRPIDLMLVGRRDRQVHDRLQDHFVLQGSDRFYLDFVTRTKGPLDPIREHQILMDAYSRSKAALCFEPSGMPRFSGRSPMLVRWVHAWASGCTVVGTRPFGLGTAEQMDWPESTLELPEAPERWGPFVEEVLGDEAGLEIRSRRNVIEALRRHDLRWRLCELFDTLGIARPPQLVAQVASLEARIKELAAPSL